MSTAVGRDGETRGEAGREELRAWRMSTARTAARWAGGKRRWLVSSQRGRRSVSLRSGGGDYRHTELGLASFFFGVRLRPGGGAFGGGWTMRVN